MRNFSWNIPGKDEKPIAQTMIPTTGKKRFAREYVGTIDSDAPPEILQQILDDSLVEDISPEDLRALSPVMPGRGRERPPLASTDSPGNASGAEKSGKEAQGNAIDNISVVGKQNINEKCLWPSRLQITTLAPVKRFSCCAGNNTTVIDEIIVP